MATVREVECRWRFNSKQAIARISLIATCVFNSAFAHGAGNQSEQQLDVDQITVLGQRASLNTARGIKLNAIPLVDAITSDSINKLPDYNISDAIQRVPGIQIARDRGEGSVIAIRGLTQVETLFNGREVFTAGNGRALDYADIPSEMLAQINVYKSASAEHIEGGVGGLADLVPIILLILNTIY